jgi:hypothetical protein
MNFKYFLDNAAGWAGVTFESGSFSKTYMISTCMGESLESLLGGIIALFDMCKKNHVHSNFEDNHLDEKNNFWWCLDHLKGSTTAFIFSFSGDLKKINLKIIERYEEEKCVFDEEIDSNELLDCIISSCDELLSKYGLVGYYTNFWQEFPVLCFLLLKDYKTSKLVFDTFKQECPHGNVYDMRRTNLNVELEYLSNK